MSPDAVGRALAEIPMMFQEFDQTSLICDQQTVLDFWREEKTARVTSALVQYTICKQRQDAANGTVPCTCIVRGAY